MPIYLGDVLIHNGTSSEYDFTQEESGMIVSPTTVMYPMEVAWYEYVNSISPTGNLADLPSAIKYVYSTGGMTGDLADIPASVVGIYIQSSGITGDLADISKSVTHINLYNCTSITGDLGGLSSSLTSLDVGGDPLISGVYIAGANIKSLSFDGNGMSPADTDATLIALDASGAENGFGSFNANRTSASDDAVASLRLKGWSLMA